MRRTDRFAKTIVFCVDQEHADEMRRAINNLNNDLVRDNPDYVCRVTSDEGDIGRGHLSNFQDLERRTPVILTTSQLLIANHGTGIKQPYFSHESGAECEAAYETALHLLAKEVLAEEKRILLPSLKVTVDRQLLADASRKLALLKSRMVPIPDGVTDLLTPTTTIVPASHYQKFEQVDVEVFLDAVIPDVVMHVGGRTLLVEIFVTHAVTDAKRRWLEENGLPMAEFDFSAADRTIGKADLKRAFLQPRRPIGDGSSKWIHHPTAGSDQEAVNNDFQAKYLDRLDPLVAASDHAAQAACHHEPTPMLGDDGVRRSLCRKCWKFFGRIPR